MRFIAPSTAIKSPQRRLQEGQAIVLIALLLLVLFAMLGLAIDSGRAYVDRRDQQAAVDAAALAAGDWFENYADLAGSTIPQSVQVYQGDLRLYSGWTSTSHVYALVGVNSNLPQDTYTYTYAGNYTLTIVATNTQFNGYQFVFTTVHQLPLAFMQIFGGPTTATITATATSIVGNQRQTPALLTLSTDPCATHLQGSGSLTVLGDTYTNGTACVDNNLHEAGNCYGAAGSNCNVAAYYCYNSSPGFVPYDPAIYGGSCLSGDTIGQPVVPAPSLPDPGYTAPSQTSYLAAGLQLDRGSYTEMTPGQYGSFHLTGGSGCYFLDAGVYTWTNGYQSDGGLVSNELKAPEEERWNMPGTTTGAVSPFWAANSCDGRFNLSVSPVAPGNGMKHQGGGGNWGVELTSVRYDRFSDGTILPDPCLASPGCRRESAPSACQLVNTLDGNNSGINVNITKNSPGAQYYLVYINPNGCDNQPNNFSFVGRYLAPGWIDAGAPPAIAVGAPWTGTLVNGAPGGWPCPAPFGLTVTICNIAFGNVTGTTLCFAQARSQGCQPPDDETKPQCFAVCPPAPAVPQDNAAMSLQYPPLYTGGDVANENYCQLSPNPGLVSAPCATAKITPGAVQFYFPNGSCLTQNGGGYTHVFSGEQYNWIVIFQAPGNVCLNKLNGNALTQYIGTIYSPTASWDILGSDISPLAGQVICYTATVTGSGNAGIDFNPNYAPAPPAARLIN
ncbi:MAG: hypothetical protein AUI42_04760 [Actinobacteria bacterium 13_1_40CM_2_65_8]|nr:MAG: hypothetical protein AUI42_04760 [Actinobacteria bacterium 13_1_40CM_2_65_8]